MNRAILSSLVLSGLAAPGLAQEGLVNGGNTNMVLINPTSTPPTAKTLPWSASSGSSAGSTRGHAMFGHGQAYRSAWTLNGIVVDNYRLSTPTVVNLVNDTTNQIMGAPYQPVFDLDHVGGPGILCIDGNNPTGQNVTARRNLFVVDVNAKTFRFDGHFSNALVPMADFYRNPHKPGEFLGVGFSTSDTKVSTFTTQGSFKAMTPGTLLTLANHCSYDALIHEDQKLYCWHSSMPTSTTQKVGFQVVDIKAKTQSFLPVTGITHAASGYAAVWNEPFEKPGRIAYVLQEAGGTDALYSVDLKTGKATAISVTIPTGSYNTGRSVEDGQLMSWKVKGGGTHGNKRRFAIDFGTVQQGDIYFLFPTLAGYSSTPITVNGNEIWLQPDIGTFLAATNALGAKTLFPFTTTAGQTTVDIDLPVLNVPAVWACALISNNKVVDVSNYLIVQL